MTYRRKFAIAVSAIALAGSALAVQGPDSFLAQSFLKAFEVLKNKTIESIHNRKNNSRNYTGLKDYCFLDCQKFDLLNATVLLRHGARTPVYFMESKYDAPDWESGSAFGDMLPALDFDVDVKEIPSGNFIDEDSIMDEYMDRVKGNCQWGQLTRVGQEQSIYFGKELRRIYMDGYEHIKPSFNLDEIYCRTTKFPRTFYSLKGVLSGIYGADSFDSCRRPIFHTMAIESDTLYPNTHLCPALGEFIVSGAAEISKDPEVIKMKCMLRELLGVDELRYESSDRRSTKEKKQCDNLANVSNASNLTKEGLTSDENVPIYAVRDDFLSREIHDFYVPKDFDYLLPEISRLSSEEILYEYLGGSVEWEDRISLSVSPILNVIKGYMNTTVDNFGTVEKSKVCITDIKETLTKRKHGMKMQLVSCHDTTLIPLLVCFRIYDGEWPPFMSSLIFELYRERGSECIFTRIVYNGEVQYPKLNEEACLGENRYLKKGLIPYAEFLSFVDNYSFPDQKYASACDKALKLFASKKPVSKKQFI